MKTKILVSFVLVLICICQITHAQITFQKAFGGINSDYGNSVQQNSDSGYIITGYTNNFGSGVNDDIYLIRTNATGDTLWTKTFGGAEQDRSYSVQQTSDGGFIVIGNTDSFGAGNMDVYLIRTDAGGNTLWAKTYGGAGADFGYAVHQTIDDGFIVAGKTDLGAGVGDVYLLRIRSNGDTVWTRTFGGSGNDAASSVQQTSDGGFIIGGTTSSFGAGAFDFYLIKTDANGVLSWAKTYGGAGYDNGNFVQQTSDKGYIFVGSTASFGAGSNDVYLIKTDSTGTLSWSKTYGGVNSDYGNSVQQTSDGYIIIGQSMSFNGSYLIKTDPNGNPSWTKTFGGSIFDWGSSVQQTFEGGFVIAGYTMSFGAGNMDVTLIKTDASGSSGCEEGNPATVTGTPASQTGNPFTLVSHGGTITTPATIIHSGGIITTLCIALGINEVSTGNSILISPNPFSNTLSIKGTKITGFAKLYDVSGKEIMQQKTVDGETTINTGDILPGLYMLTYLDGNKTTSTKIVKY